MQLLALACLFLTSAVAAYAADGEAACESNRASPLQSNSMLQMKSAHKTKAASVLVDDEGDEEVGTEVVGAGRRRSVTKIRSSDFASGTLRITKPGSYVLKEDVEFNPIISGMSWSSIPPDCPEYPQTSGYFLGFFSALSIEVDNVELNCKGHEIKMSKHFHKLQRFFSIIELGSTPFPIGQGPPQFASNFTTPDTPVVANNVVIRNCRLGLSSHHSVHGNDVTGLTLKNVQMYDFEVAGVALNGASQVVLENLDIGPSLKQTFHAGLSQAIFLDHLASTLMESDPSIAALKRSTSLTLRGQAHTVQDIFHQLRTDLQTFVSTGAGPLLPITGDGTALPDGSAIYGVLLHRSGVAINQLGVCPDDALVADKRVSSIRLEDVHIFDLSVKVDQVVNLVVNDRIVAGPAGDVFQVVNAWDPSSCYEYVGNIFMDAELAIGKLCEDLASTLPPNELSFYCGGTYVPQDVRTWAEGSMPCATSTNWAKSVKLTCLGDAMNHHNKGAMGLRLGFQEDVTVKNVLVEDVFNHGVPNAAPHCAVPGGDYEGVDVRTASLAHMKDLHKFDVEQKGSLSGTNSSRVFPITGFLQMRADDAKVQD